MTKDATKTAFRLYSRLVRYSAVNAVQEQNRFETPNPFQPDIVVSIDSVVDKKLDALAVMESSSKAERSATRVSSRATTSTASAASRKSARAFSAASLASPASTAATWSSSTAKKAAQKSATPKLLK